MNLLNLHELPVIPFLITRLSMSSLRLKKNKIAKINSFIRFYTVFNKGSSKSVGAGCMLSIVKPHFIITLPLDVNLTLKFLRNSSTNSSAFEKS